MHLIYKHQILKILERLFAIGVPILFVIIERYLVIQPTYKILDAYIITQILQILLGSSVFLAFYKNNINISQLHLYKFFILASIATAFITFTISENIIALFSIAYIACIPIELQNVFTGKQYKNFFVRIVSVFSAIGAFLQFNSIELSFIVERATYTSLLLILNFKSPYIDQKIPLKESLINFQVLSLLLTGVFTLLYGKLEQIFLLYGGGKSNLADYIIVLRVFDIFILLLNSLVLARISNKLFDLNSVRKIVDTIACISLCITTLIFLFTDVINNTYVYFLIILINYYFMSWGVIKMLFTYHHIRHTANLKCQLVGVSFVGFYVLLSTIFFEIKDIPFGVVITMPAIGQIGTNLIGPLLIKSERKFLSLLLYKEKII